VGVPVGVLVGVIVGVSVGEVVGVSVGVAVGVLVGVAVLGGTEQISAKDAMTCPAPTSVAVLKSQTWLSDPAVTTSLIPPAPLEPPVTPKSYISVCEEPGVKFAVPSVLLTASISIA
jgi:hypothetical protein